MCKYSYLIYINKMISSLKKGINLAVPRFYHSYLLKDGKVVNSDYSEIADVLI
jgi:hypothetical protein